MNTRPTTDDEIQEKYLERAIRELNALTRRLQQCSHCPRGNLMPVLGSGHPQADIFLLKHSPSAAEIGEGVERVVEEIAIVQPRCIVAMGEDALLTLNELQVPLSEPVEPRLGEMQKLTPTMDVLFVPDIDGSLDSEEPKREFWRSFRVL